MKKIYFFSLLAVVSLCATSCKDDKNEPENQDPVTYVSEGAYVLTEGNLYNAIEGGLDFIDYADGTIERSVFKSANGRSLGDTPQCGVAYGTKLYVGTSQSNTIEIIDRTTFKSIKQIRLSDVNVDGTSPWSMAAYKGKVFISMYDGYLARLDTLTMTIDKSVAVGPNPGIITIYKDKVYVPLSDGMSYPDYGRTACVVDPQSMNVEATFETGLNPTEMLTTGDRLFVLCNGNYSYDPATLVKSQLYEIKDDLTVRAVCDATVVGSFGNKVAIVNQPFSTDVPVAEYKLYNTISGQTEEWNIEKPDYVNSIYYDCVAERLLIGSYVMNGIYPDYQAPGYVNVYDDNSQLLQSKLMLGTVGRATIFSLCK